jgi:hypothetical protein
MLLLWFIAGDNGHTAIAKPMIRVDSVSRDVVLRCDDSLTASSETLNVWLSHSLALNLQYRVRVSTWIELARIVLFSFLLAFMRKATVIQISWLGFPIRYGLYILRFADWQPS